MKSVLITLLLLILSSGLVRSGETPDNIKPYFSLSSDEKLNLVTKAKTVQIGETYDSVISKMGKPTYDQMMTRKENREIIGRSLKYYTVRWENGFVNEIHDQLIIIFFDANDHVADIMFKIKDD